MSSRFNALIPFVVFFGSITALVCVNIIAAAVAKISASADDRELVSMMREVSIAFALILLLWPIFPAIFLLSRYAARRRSLGTKMPTNRPSVFDVLVLGMIACNLDRLLGLPEVIRGNRGLASVLGPSKDAAPIGSQAERISNLTMVAVASMAGWTLFLHPGASWRRLQFAGAPEGAWQWARFDVIAISFSLCVFVLGVTAAIGWLQDRKADPRDVAMGLIAVTASFVMLVWYGGLMQTIASMGA